MARYAAISEDISVSEDWADLVAADPKAAVIYAMSWPHADFYGILPGSPRKFAAKVCPLLGLTPAKTEKIIALLVEHGLVVRYQADNEWYLWLPKWGARNDIRWDKVRTAPSNPFPENWTPPDSLVKYLDKAEDSCPLLEWFDRSGKFLSVPGSSGNYPPSRARAQARCVLAVDVSESGESDDAIVAEGSLIALNSMHLRDVVREVIPGLRGREIDRWVEEIATAAQEENYPATEEEIIAALREDRPSTKAYPKSWLGGLEKRLHARRGEAERAKASVAYTSSLPDEHWEDPFVRICDRPREVQDQLSAWKSHCLFMDPSEENPIKDWLKAQLADYAAGTLTADDFPFPPAAEPQEAAV